MPSTYPADSDVTSLLTSMGAQLPSGFSVTGYAAQAVAEWERRTGYIPFLNTSGVDATRTFDPPGPNQRVMYGTRLMGGGMILDLKAGLYSLTSVTVGVTLDNPTGVLFTLGRDFWLEPVNADVESKPFEFIRFRVQQFGSQHSIQVIGRFGYGATIPQDAWEAIRRLGASLALKDVAEGLKTGLRKASELDVSEEYDPAMVDQLGDAARCYAERILRSYTRTTWL